MSLISYYGGIFQISYVARDLEQAMAFLRKKMGAQDFLIREPQLTVTVGGEQRPLSMHVALANVGDRQIEVIQPVSGAIGLYVDGIDYERSTLTFHHVGIAVPGPLAQWTAMEEQVHASGDSFALSFAADVSPEFQVRFAYVDTRP